MARSFNKIALAGLISGIIIIAALSFSNFRHVINKDAPDIFNQLLIPYGQAVTAKNWQAAYEMTAKKYRENFRFDEFKKRQINNYENYGRILSIKPTSGIFIIYGVKRPPVYRGTVTIKREKKTFHALFTITTEGGKYKIVSSSPSSLSIRDEVPEVY